MTMLKFETSTPILWESILVIWDHVLKIPDAILLEESQLALWSVFKLLLACESLLTPCSILAGIMLKAL